MIVASEVAEQLRDLLAAQNVRVYLDVVPASPVYPYVAIFSDAGRRTDESLGAQMESGDFYPRMTCVGGSAAFSKVPIPAEAWDVAGQQIRAVRDRAMRIVGQEITTPSGAMARVEHAGSSTVARDEDIPDRVVFYAVETLRLRALAA